jgi:hypothetical protein
LFVVWVARGSSVAVWVLAFFGWLRRVRRGKWDLSALVLAVVPFPMLLFQSYGGEMIFRIYLFSLPWMVFFNALLLRPAPEQGSSRRAVLATILLNGILLACLHFSYFGQERLNYMTDAELDAAQYIYAQIPGNSFVASVTWNFPFKLQGNYDDYPGLFINELQEVSPAPFPITDVEAVRVLIRERMAGCQCRNGYLVISRSQKVHSDMRGLFPPGTLDALEQSLSHAEEFRVVYENRDVRIFELVGQ